jgi:hypothetical protein
MAIVRIEYSHVGFVAVSDEQLYHEEHKLVTVTDHTPS